MRDATSALKRRAALFVAGSAFLLVHQTPTGSAEPRKAPEFPTQDRSHWVGDPVWLEDLRGKVVLLDVWTFG